jgi:uncharacterized glyoxalase superfamily protein PhnB
VTVRRITPYLVADDFGAVREFYAGFVGLTEGEFGGEHVGFAEGSHQVVAARAGSQHALPTMGIDVGTVAEVDRLHAEAVTRGLEIVYGPADEPWGIHRFFVRDPTGAVVSILAHA